MHLFTKSFLNIFPVVIFSASLSFAAEFDDIHKSIIESYNHALPPNADGIAIESVEANKLVHDLLLFTENNDRTVAGATIENILNVFSQRFPRVFALAIQFPCLQNDLAMAAMLGFKPRSEVQCQDVDYDALKNGIDSISGLTGYYPFELERDAKDGFFAKLQFSYLVYFSMTSYLYDFNVDNHEWIAQISANDSGAYFERAGQIFGYDQVNTRLFHSGVQNGSIVASTAHFGTDKLFWISFEGGKEAGNAKMRGYEILLTLARLNWDYVDNQH